MLTGKGMVICYPDPGGGCKVWQFAETKKLTSFHDGELARCTKQINSLLRSVEKNNKDPKRNLCILDTPNGPFLAWTEHGNIGPYDKPTDIEEAFGLK